MNFQTRSETRGLKSFSRLEWAFDAAREDPTIWKISWIENGESIRLVRAEGEKSWDLEPIILDFNTPGEAWVPDSLVE
jgi:hypothetical protein